MLSFVFYASCSCHIHTVYVQENPKFLNQLFTTLRDDHLSDDKRRDLMLFLKEFCVFSQTLQQQNRDHFFQVVFVVLTCLSMSIRLFRHLQHMAYSMLFT
jgi:hypothetical protein